MKFTGIKKVILSCMILFITFGYAEIVPLYPEEGAILSAEELTVIFSVNSSQNLTNDVSPSKNRVNAA